MEHIIADAERVGLFRPRLVRLDPPLSRRTHAVGNPNKPELARCGDEHDLWTEISKIESETFTAVVTNPVGGGLPPPLYIPLDYIQLAYRDADGHLKLDLDVQVYVDKDERPRFEPPRRSR